ncbi:NADPH:quinone reductase [Klenkia soli]|uniref:NADPH:quinone reductase n=1 Tax=Klenkia soli TaxID=1052260 RepID=A0A1H0RQS4_9ACTN|nr:NADP-dependent oxidoreductase [Klenkia soli]SDP31862.1 NADPH:quinone reductase [Klenkia soli]
MKAVRFHEYGSADVLRLEDAPDPVPGPGEVRVRVAGVAFNPVDAGIRGGWVREAFPIAFPHVPGYDASGVVDQLGPDVTDLAVGDRVVGFLPMVADGAAAELVVAPEQAWVAAPTSVPLVDAAALPSPATTAWQAVVADAGLTAGQRLFVNGAGGAVGSFAVQLAAAAGIEVTAATGAAGAEHVRAEGAQHVVQHGQDLGELGPFDAVLNLGRVDADAARGLLDLLRPDGVLVNTVPGVPVPDDPRVVGLFVRPDRAALRRLVEMVDRGELHVDVAQRLPLAELAGVHARSDDGGLRGKVVLVP